MINHLHFRSITWHSVNKTILRERYHFDCIEYTIKEIKFSVFNIAFMYNSIVCLKYIYRPASRPVGLGLMAPVWKKPYRNGDDNISFLDIRRIRADRMYNQPKPKAVFYSAISRWSKNPLVGAKVPR